MKPIQYLAIGLLLGVASCKEIEKPVTQQEASVFAQSIVKSLAKKDPKIYNEAMDLNLLAERITSRNKQRSSSYWNGLKQGLRGAINFGTKILDGLGQNGTYSLVRQYEKEGKQHLLFRFFAATGFNYHDVELAHKNDQVKIADVYVYTTGEYFSETLERLFAQTKDKDNYYYLKELSNLNEMVKNGQYQRVKNKIDEMPPNLRALKSVQISYIVVCSNISDSAHRLAIERYERDFPNDPSLNIVLIDGYFVKKEYDKALQCVNKLDQQLGSDPFLDYYRGLLYKQMGNREEAFSVLKRLYRNVPTFSMGALELSALYLDEGDNENAASIIRSTQQNRDYDPSHVQYLCSLYPQLKPLVEQ